MLGKSLVGLDDGKRDGRPFRAAVREKTPKKPQTVSPTSGSEAVTNFQRIGASSNTQVGIDFERLAVFALEAAGLKVQPRFSVPVGVGDLKKQHAFDFGSSEPPILIECKCHRWTRPGDNAPSAKLTVWNEAMYYFSIAPSGYRCILFVLRDYSATRGQTLAEYYLTRYRHLVPRNVEIWEFDEARTTCASLSP
jgi:hypothetical protein